MAEVVAAELQLEPVSGGVALGRLHHAGVVDQDVDRAAFCVQFRTEFGDAGQRGQVEVLDGQFGVGDLGADVGDRGFALGAVADRHDHVGACGGEAFGDAESQSAVGTGDDGEFPGEVGEGEGEISHAGDVNRTTV